MERRDIVERYRQELQPRCDQLATRLAALAADLCLQAGVPVAHIEHRAKTLESVLAKIARKNYTAPFSEMRDLCGVRIVTYYDDDAKRVADLIRREFRVDDIHSLDKFSELDVDEFGYRSIHLVCFLSEPRKSLVEWAPFSELAVEFQIRSVLQHAWAAISHKLDYKRTSQAPQEIRRQLFRLSALLELADEQFTDIRDEAHVISERYRANVDSGRLDVPVNLDSLREFLIEGRLAAWQQIGLEAGMLRSSLKLLDPADIQDLASTLAAGGITTLEAFDDELSAASKTAVEDLGAFLKILTERGESFTAIGPDVLSLVIALRHRVALSPRFRPPIRAALEEYLSR